MAPRTSPLLLAALVASACHDGYDPAPPRLWSPDDVVATDDGLYAPLDAVGGLALLRPGQAAARVPAPDLRLRELAALPDRSGLLTRWSQQTCAGERVPLETIDDCAWEDRGEVWQTSVLRDGAIGAAIEDQPWFGAWQISPDGAYALSFVTATQEQVPAGTFVNLGAMRVLDVAAGTTWEVAVGTGVNQAVFLPDASGTTVRVAVLRRNEVAMVDVTTPAAAPFAVYPLTLSATDAYQPTSAAITPDLGHLLVTVDGVSDLYVLDLVNPSVNLIGLAGAPQELIADPARDSTLIRYAGAMFLDRLDHADFSTTRLTLPLAPTAYALSNDQLLLWRPNQTPIVARVDLTTDEVISYPLDAAVTDVHLAPDASFALAVSAQAGRVDLLSMGVDGRGRPDTDPRPFATGGQVGGVAFDPRDDGSTDMLLLLSNSAAVYRLGWPSLLAGATELAAPPTAVGAMPAGGFWLTHAFSLGLVSFLAPSGEATTVSGFAVDGALDAPYGEPLYDTYYGYDF
jgi:hypothetical protein